MNAISVIWFGSAAVGLLAATIGIFAKRARQPSFQVAGIGFMVAGVLGIFSIGIFFVALAALCFTKASRLDTGSARASVPPPPPPPSPPPR